MLLAKTFVRQDMFSGRPLHFFSSCSYSNLCRTVTVQDGSVRDSTIQVISQRILVLLDYLLHKLPYWSTGNYAKKVNHKSVPFLCSTVRKPIGGLAMNSNVLHCC